MNQDMKECSKKQILKNKWMELVEDIDETQHLNTGKGLHMKFTQSH